MDRSQSEPCDRQLADRQQARVDCRYALCFLELGDLYERTRRHAEALDAYLHPLRLAPLDVDVHLALAQALTGQRHFREAIALLDRALRLDPERSSAYSGLARARLGAGDWNEAEALVCIERGLASAAPRASGRVDLCDLYIDKADLLLRRASSEDLVAVIRLLRTALNERPRDVRACRLLVDALQRAERSERPRAASEDEPRQQADAVGDAVGAWFSLGGALEAAGEWREAASAYERAIERKPDCLRAWLKLGDVQLARGDPGAAVRCLEAAVAIDPEHPAARVNLGWAMRTAGDFGRGWKESAWNYRASDKRRFEQPMWDGAPLDGRTLLVWADFALGDTIQDLRYLALVRASQPRARIVLECDRRLVSLVEEGLTSPASQSPIDLELVVANKAPLPAFDTHLPLRRLPELLGIELHSIPQGVPYLAADAVRVAIWRQRLDQCKQRPDQSAAKACRRHHHNRMSAASTSIGIVWAGDHTRTDARTKSASLVDFEPLARVAQSADLRIISLQLGPNVDELMAAPPGLHVERLLDEDCDVADTAALMSSLNLIISVDTMTAHLAGALGKRVWVLASYSPAWWLWHVDADAGPVIGRSRWYPTMRVFRQERVGEWDGVMRRVCAAVRSDLVIA